MNETDRSMHSIVRDKSERGEQETISLSILDADILKNIIERKEKKYEEEINELRTN